MQTKFVTGPDADSIAFDSKGNLFVSDPQNQVLVKITPGGAKTTFDSGYAPAGLAFDAAGNLFVADSGFGRIYKYLPNGTKTIFASGVSGPFGLAFDRAGNLYVSEFNTNSILKFAPNGTQSAMPFASGLHGPQGLAFDSAGNLFEVDFSTGSINKISPAGVVTLFASSLSGPRHLAFDRNGNLFASDFGTQRILEFPPNFAVGDMPISFASSTSAAGLTFEPTPTYSLFETESLNVQALSGATHSLISSANLSGAKGTQLNATATGQYVTYSVPVAAAGTYTVQIGVKTGPGLGMFRLNIDGVNQGQAQDEYTSAVGYTFRDLGTVTFFGGGNKGFQFLVSGKNVSSSGYVLGLDYIKLIPTNRQETESLKVQSITPVPAGISSAQWFGVYKEAIASGGAGTYFNANAVGNFISYTVAVAQPGTYRVRVGTQTKPNKGIFQLSINGVKQGFTVDEYSPTVAYGVQDLGTITFLNAGNQTFTFTVNGHNVASTGYTLAFDYIELVPTSRQETEALKVQSITPVPAGTSSAVWFGVFKDATASGDAGTYFNANAVGNYITYAVSVAKAGTYHVQVGIQTKPNKGIFQLAINGVSQGAVQDEYNASVGYAVRDLGTVYLNSGNQVFKFTVAGKNASSTGYTLAFDYIELVP